jgi:prepilin-type N-terminal cleavage/methylation domain-containing protein
MIGNKKNKSAFSLIEVIVSVAIFSVIILTVTDIFRLVMDGQRTAIATQNVQESLKYFLEVTGKEIRMAKRSDGSCPGVTAGSIFGLTDTAGADILSFKNYYDECVSYQLETFTSPLYGEVQRFQITRDLDTDFISPAQINIDRLDFVLSNELSKQPLISLNLKAHALGVKTGVSEMIIQSSLSSRYYKVD